tara:strand:+ start:40649 stop:41698 length:1050 start_codon:yes stop_codon:yes gene_type:complete
LYKLFILIFLTFECLGQSGLESVDLSFNALERLKLSKDIADLKQRNFRLDKELKNYHGVITCEKSKFKVIFSIHGDLHKHWRDERKSFDIKIKSQGTCYGMKNFSLVRADDKHSELEVLGQRLSKRLNLFHRKIKLINLIVNKKKHENYLIYEKITPDALEHNGLSGAFIIGQNNSWKLGLVSSESSISSPFMDKDIKDSINSHKLVFYSARPNLENFNALSQWKFFLNSFNPEYINLDDFVSYLTIVSITGSYHSVIIDNLRWIYRPWTGKFSPIYYDTIPQLLPKSFENHLNEIKRLNFLASKVLQAQTTSYWLAKIKQKVLLLEGHLLNDHYFPIQQNLEMIKSWK